MKQAHKPADSWLRPPQLRCLPRFSPPTVTAAQYLKLGGSYECTLADLLSRSLTGFSACCAVNSKRGMHVHKLQSSPSSHPGEMQSLQVLGQRMPTFNIVIEYSSRQLLKFGILPL